MKRFANGVSRRWKARHAVEFYEKHVELSYDFEGLAKKHKMIAEQLPEIAGKRRQTLAELSEVTAELERAKKEDQSKVMAEFQQYREERLKQRNDEKAHLKKLHREGQISAKAFANEKRQKDLAASEDIRSKKQLLPLEVLTDRVRYLKHRLRQDEKQALTVLNSDIADLRRKTPIEDFETVSLGFVPDDSHSRTRTVDARSDSQIDLLLYRHALFVFDRDPLRARSRQLSRTRVYSDLFHSQEMPHDSIDPLFL